MSKIKKVAIWSGVIVLAIISVWYSVTVITAPSEFKNVSQQYEQVEVISKRMRTTSSGGKFANYITYDFIIAFKFTDGSIKEFEVDSIGKRTSNKSEVKSSVYDAINEGDTGILTYKELENIEERYKEEKRYYGRHYINFKNDNTPNPDTNLPTYSPFNLR